MGECITGYALSQRPLKFRPRPPAVCGLLLWIEPGVCPHGVPMTTGRPVLCLLCTQAVSGSRNRVFRVATSKELAAVQDGTERTQQRKPLPYALRKFGGRRYK